MLRKMMKFLFVCLILEFFIFKNVLYAVNLPVFSFEDQYQNQLSSKNLNGYPIVLIGCEKDDIELCRKMGRKIFWKLQNLLWKDSPKVKFVPYLNLTVSNQVIEKYIKDSKSRNFESIYLDRKGELTEGLRSDFVFFRIFNKKGIELKREYFESVTDEKVKEIYEILKKEI